MKRVYLDWNVYSYLKKEAFQKLRAKLEERLDELIIPYSPAHFDDLMKSYSPDNEYFDEDIRTLSMFSGDWLLTHDEKNGVIPSKCTPQEYKASYRSKEDFIDLMNMEAIFSEVDEYSGELGLGKLGSLMRALYKLQPCGIEFTDQNKALLNKMFPNLTPTSSMWDLMKQVGPFTQKLFRDREFYIDFRKSIHDKGFKLENNSGNWDSHDVIRNIDSFLAQMGVDMNYEQLVQSTLEHNKTRNSFYDEFISSYNMLDMIGYKSDKLPKETDNFQNIAADGDHAFFAMHCDLFVVGDKKLAKKAAALYHKYDIKTEVVSPNELMDNFDEIICQIGRRDINLFEGLAEIIGSGNELEYYPMTEDNPAETYAYELPCKYFDYFTHFVHRFYPNTGNQVLTFRFADWHQSRFLLYQEISDLFDRITEFLDFESDNIDILRSKFVERTDDFKGIHWQLDTGLMILDYPEGENFPTLSFLWTMLPVKEEE